MKGKKKRGSTVQEADPNAALGDAVDAQAGAANSEEASAPDAAEAATDRFLRLQADFENFRKRTLRERDDLYRRANEDIVLELLPVLDHLDLALEAAQAHGSEDVLVEGVQLVAEQMASVLNRFGVVAIDGQGHEFDPNLHEAISSMPSAEAAENTIVQQTRRGYRLGDKLLRPAQVIVSSGPPVPGGV